MFREYLKIFHLSDLDISRDWFCTMTDQRKGGGFFETYSMFHICVLNVVIRQNFFYKSQIDSETLFYAHGEGKRPN